MSLVRSLINWIFLFFITAVCLVNVVFYDFWIRLPVVKPGYSVFILICSALLFVGLLSLKNKLRFLEKPMMFFWLYFFLTAVFCALFYHGAAWDILFTTYSLSVYEKTHMLTRYLFNYPNNFAYFGILTLFNYIVPITSTYFHQALDIFNAFLISLSLTIIGMRLKSINKMWTKYFYLLCLLFLPLLLYATIPYTDTFSLIFIAVFLFFFVPNPSTKKEWIYYAVALIAVACGTLVKQTIIFFILAASISAIVMPVKKRSLVHGLLVILPFICFFLSYFIFSNIYIYGYLHVNKTSLAQAMYPMEHWMAMGQNDRTFGIFSSIDETSTRRLVADKGSDQPYVHGVLRDKLEHRIASRGVIGNNIFFTYKFSKLWGQPDFYAFKEGGDCDMSGIIQNTRCTDRDSDLYSHILQLADIFYTMIIFVILAGSYKTIETNKEPHLFLLCKVAIIAITMFLLFWEARSRYVLNIMPCMLLIASYYFALFAKEIRQTDVSK
jgi:hypothetical protein